MNIYDDIRNAIKGAVADLGLPAADFVLEHPADLSHGDFATNVAMQLAKQAGKNPRELAEQIKSHLEVGPLSNVEEIEVAGPGFINFFLAPGFFTDMTGQVAAAGDQFGRNDSWAGRQVMVEYTDPNPFKVFHIGHLMPNVTGEAIARLYENGGADVVRASYQGDVGPHVARSLYGMQLMADERPADDAPITKRTAYLGRAYALGATKHKEDPEGAGVEIDAINKGVYEQYPNYNQDYIDGRQWSLDHFEVLYKKLGTKFNVYYFEGEVFESGVRQVMGGVDKGIFKESDGAVIYEGEKHGLHTRVFINGRGLATYEAKEVGLNTKKLTDYPMLDHSIIVTGSEQAEYFKVVIEALKELVPKVGNMTQHIYNGFMFGPGGKKMASRTGDVITGESLIIEMEDEARAKMTATKLIDPAKIDELSTQVAVAAIKYMLLKQQTGKNIIFDREQALSFEGDSGPYLQYTYARSRSILRKATEQNLETGRAPTDWQVTEIERLMYRFPQLAQRALVEHQPHYVANFLIEIARAFNSWYGKTQIINVDDPATPYRLALVDAVGTTLRNGLRILGITAPEQM